MSRRALQARTSQMSDIGAAYIRLRTRHVSLRPSNMLVVNQTRQDKQKKAASQAAIPVHSLPVVSNRHTPESVTCAILECWQIVSSAMQLRKNIGLVRTQPGVPFAHAMLARCMSDGKPHCFEAATIIESLARTSPLRELARNYHEVVGKPLFCPVKSLSSVSTA